MSTREECLRAEGAINALDVTGVRIGELETENLNLRLLADSADMYWDDEDDFDCPESFAESADLKVGDEFVLTASAYWKTKHRVTKVPDSTSDDWDTEDIGEKRGGEFAEYFKLKAENAALKARTLSCVFCGDTASTVAALKKHSATCAKHPAVIELAEARKLAQWTPITPENLPTDADEVYCSKTGQTRSTDQGARNPIMPADAWAVWGWTHFRPITPPQEAPRG